MRLGDHGRPVVPLVAQRREREVHEIEHTMGRDHTYEGSNETPDSLSCDGF